MTPTGSIPKIRPYLRKMSTKEDTDQGRLDLSKSISENHALSGLGIQDHAPRSASDVSFTHTTKRSHARTTSGESQLSTASGSLRPTKAFVHPMRQTPRPYTPPHGHSFDSTLNDEERNESDDVLTDDDFRLGHGFRSRRSMSISSTPIIAPTPLSQSHTASDLGMVPKITSNGANNSSQTNLSLKSNKSGKSTKSRRPSLGHSRRNTDRSFETPPTTTTTPSARTSFDKAFSFASVGRRSDTDPLTRDQRIQAARRKFEEAEAKKERKAEERVSRRRETEEKQRRKSEAGERAKKKSSSSTTRTKAEEEEKGGRSLDDSRPEDHTASLPRRAETSAKGKAAETKLQGGVARFSTWMQTRVLSCGGTE